MAEPSISIDIGAYMAGKADGTVRVIKLNGVVHYTQKRFDPNTAKPTPVFVALDDKGVAAVRAELQARVAALDELLRDIAAAPELLDQA